MGTTRVVDIRVIHAEPMKTKNLSHLIERRILALQRKDDKEKSESVITASPVSIESEFFFLIELFPHSDWKSGDNYIETGIWIDTSTEQEDGQEFDGSFIIRSRPDGRVRLELHIVDPINDVIPELYTATRWQLRHELKQIKILNWLTEQVYLYLSL